MPRTRLSTTVNSDLLEDARRVRSGITDAALIDEALGALLVRHEPDEWGDLASFRKAAGAS